MKPGQDNRKAPMQNLFFGLTGEELGSAVGCEQSLGLALCLSSAFFTDCPELCMAGTTLWAELFLLELAGPCLPKLPEQLDVAVEQQMNLSVAQKMNLSVAQQGCSLLRSSVMLLWPWASCGAEAAQEKSPGSSQRINMP